MTTEHAKHPRYANTGNIIQIGDPAHSLASPKDGMVVEIGLGFVTLADIDGNLHRVGTPRVSYGERPEPKITKQVTLPSRLWVALLDLLGDNDPAISGDQYDLITAIKNAEVI